MKRQGDADNMFGAQQRSLSSPSGGLTINTGSANAFASIPNTQSSQSGGLFGQSKPSTLFGAQTSQPINLFGSPAITTQASQPNNLFGALPAVTTQASQTSNLFSKPAVTTQSGSLFGSTATSQAGGGLFGSSTTANSTNTPQQQTRGLFGSVNTSQPQQQQQQQAPSGGLFGSSTTNQGQQQNNNMFGFLNTNSQQQQGAGLFGSSNTNQPPQQKPGGLFGLSTPQPSQSQNQNQNQQGAGLFGKPQENNFLLGTNSSMAPPQQLSNPLFASSIGQYPRDQQIVPGVRVDLANLRPTTRFNDLHEELQKVVVYVEDFIQTQIHYAEECDSMLPQVESMIKNIPTDSEYCSRKLDAAQHVLENDAAAIDAAKRVVRKDAADARMSFRAIQNLRVPQQFHQASIWNMPIASRSIGPEGGFEGSETSSGANLVSYFLQQANDMSKSLQAYQNNLGEVEGYLKGVELSTMQEMANVQFSKGRDGGERNTEDQYRELAAVFREFDNGILTVAGKVLAVRENVQESVLGEDLMSGRGRRQGLY